MLARIKPSSCCSCRCFLSFFDHDVAAAADSRSSLEEARIPPVIIVPHMGRGREKPLSSSTGLEESNGGYQSGFQERTRDSGFHTSAQIISLH